MSEAIRPLHLDCYDGFRKNVKNANEQEEQARQEYKDYQEKHPEFKDIPFGEISKGFGRFRKKEETEKYMHLHQVPISDYIERNDPNGRNILLLANLSLVAVYQYWEDHYRQDIATCLKKEKNDIVSPIMGDLRTLRRSIIHNKGRAVPEIKSCEVIKWFNEGNSINITKERFEYIIDQVMFFINSMTEDYANFIKQA